MTPPAQTALRLLFADAPATVMGAPEDWPRWAVLLPHVLATLDQIEPLDGDDTTGLMVLVLLDRAAAYLQVYGRAGPTVALRLSNLGSIFRDLGEPAVARPLVERALAITDATNGPHHPTTQLVRANLDRLTDE